MRRTSLILVGVLLWGLTGSSKAFAGFSNSLRLSHSARQAGMGGVCVAIADDGMAPVCNPAGMAFQEGRVLSSENTLAFPHFEYSDPENRERSGTEGGNGVGTLNDLGFVHRLGDLPLSYGVGLYTYSAARMKYDLNTSLLVPSGTERVDFDLFMTHHRLITALAMQLGPAVSIGGGYIAGYQQYNISLPDQYSTSVEPTGVAGLKGYVDADAEGWGQGGVFGAQVKLGPRTRLGASYTMPMWVRLEGDYEITVRNDPSLVPFGVFEKDRAKFDFSAIYKWPQVASVGAAHQVTDRWLVAADWQWIDWSEAADAFDYTVSNVDHPGVRAVLTALGSTGDAREQVTLDARDAFVYQFGTEYQAHPRLVLRGGYSYATNPIKRERVMPLFNGVIQHTLALGAGTRLGVWDIDLAWNHAFTNHVAVSTSAIEGGDFNQSKTSAGADLLFLGVRTRF